MMPVAALGDGRVYVRQQLSADVVERRGAAPVDGPRDLAPSIRSASSLTLLFWRARTWTACYHTGMVHAVVFFCFVSVPRMPRTAVQASSWCPPSRTCRLATWRSKSPTPKWWTPRTRRSVRACKVRSPPSHAALVCTHVPWVVSFAVELARMWEST
jgi:hypothetical protein